MVGYESPIADVLRTAAVMRLSDSSLVRKPRLRGYIADSLWAKDSTTVFLLEFTERWLKSPRGLLRILVGHPIPLSTIFLTACNVESGDCERMQIAADLEFATVGLRRADGEGQGGTR